MEGFFWWVFDALLVIVIAWVVFANARKGMTKVLVMCIGYIVATLAASVLSAVAAPTMYEVFVQESNINAIVQVNKEVDITECLCEILKDQNYGIEIEQGRIQTFLLPPDTDKFDQNIYNYVNAKCGYQVSSLMDFKKMLTNEFAERYGEALGNHLPYYAEVNFRRQMTSDPATIHTMFTEFYSMYSTELDNAAYVQETFVKDTTIHLFQMFTYVVIFSVVMVFAALFSKLLQYSLIFNVKKTTDHLLGAVIGIIEAAVMVLLMTLVIRLIVVLCGGELMCFNEETIQATRVFKYLYNHTDLLL